MLDLTAPLKESAGPDAILTTGEDETRQQILSTQSVYPRSLLYSLKTHCKLGADPRSWINEQYCVRFDQPFVFDSMEQNQQFQMTVTVSS